MNITFSKKETIAAITFGWQTVKRNFWFFVGLLIIAGVAMYASTIIIALEIIENPIFLFMINLIGWILSITAILGLIKISLNFRDNLKSKISDLFFQYRLFFRYVFASILYFLIYLLGMVPLGMVVFILNEFYLGIIFRALFLILGIVPLIYLGIRFLFFGYFIVDQKAGVIESLRKSWKITERNVWNLFLFFLALFGLHFLGALFLLIGLFITVPTSLLAVAHVYRKLSSTAKDS